MTASAPETSAAAKPGWTSRRSLLLPRPVAAIVCTRAAVSCQRTPLLRHFCATLRDVGLALHRAIADIVGLVRRQDRRKGVRTIPASPCAGWHPGSAGLRRRSPSHGAIRRLPGDARTGCGEPGTTIPKARRARRCCAGRSCSCRPRRWYCVRWQWNPRCPSALLPRARPASIDCTDLHRWRRIQRASRCRRFSAA